MKSLITRQHDEGWAVWRSGHICDSIAVQIGKKPQPANKLSRFKPGRDVRHSNYCVFPRSAQARREGATAKLHKQHGEGRANGRVLNSLPLAELNVAEGWERSFAPDFPTL